MNIDRMHKQVVCLLGCALIVAMSVEFFPEVWGFGWHTFHGIRTTLKSPFGKKYSIRTPLMIPAWLDDSGWELRVLSRPGILRSRLGDRSFAMMGFSLSPMQITAEEMARTAPVFERKFGIQTSKVAVIPAAGEELQCFNRSDPALPLGEIADITCVPSSDKHGFSASFLGSSDLLPKFYEILRTVRREN
jgi:hypothetical protein